VSSKQRSWTSFVQDMLHAIERIRERTAGRSFDDFARDEDGVEIVAWNFHVLGEASTHIPSDVMSAHPDVPWNDMRTMRNRVIHGYFHLNRQILWDTATVELPPLIEALQELAREDGGS